MAESNIQEESKTPVRNRLSRKIASCSLDRDELHKLCQILQERSSAAGDIEVMNLKQGELPHEEMYGSISEVFDSPNFPDQVSTFYINSETILRAIHNWYPRNSFELFLDFRKPELFDFSLMPSQPTPNASNFSVQGYDVTWTNGVFSEVIKCLDRHPSTLSWLH